MKKALAVLAVGALAGMAWGAPAFATNTEKGKDRVEHFRTYPQEKICNISGLSYNNTKNLALANGATAETTDKGLKLSTPYNVNRNAKVEWKVSLATPVLLSKFTNSGMLLTKVDTHQNIPGGGNNDVALLSYDIMVDKTGDGVADFTMVYEPYWNGSVTRNTSKLWIVDGSSKVWGSPLNAWAGNVNAEANKTIDQVKALYPTAKITGYGYHQGTYNDGAVSLLSGFWFDTDDSVKEGYGWTSVCNTPKVEFKDTCTGTTVTMTNSVNYLSTEFKINDTKYEVGTSKVVENVPGATVEVRYGNYKKSDHTWVKPNNCASPSSSTSVTPSTSSSPTAAVPGTPGGSLPVTGSKIWVLAGVGTLLVAVGVAAIMVSRNKRDAQFIAE